MQQILSKRKRVIVRIVREYRKSYWPINNGQSIPNIQRSIEPINHLQFASICNSDIA